MTELDIPPDMDLSCELQGMGYHCAYSAEQPAKEFYVQVKGGMIDMRVFVIAEQYGYHFNNKVKIGRPAGRRNTDNFNVYLILDYEPAKPKGQWRKVDNKAIETTRPNESNEGSSSFVCNIPAEDLKALEELASNYVDYYCNPRSEEIEKWRPIVEKLWRAQRGYGYTKYSGKEDSAN